MEGQVPEAPFWCSKGQRYILCPGPFELSLRLMARSSGSVSVHSQSWAPGRLLLTPGPQAAHRGSDPLHTFLTSRVRTIAPKIHCLLLQPLLILRFRNGLLRFASHQDSSALERRAQLRAFGGGGLTWKPVHEGPPAQTAAASPGSSRSSLFRNSGYP